MTTESTSRGRLEKILNQVKDSVDRDIIKQVMDVEIDYRSTDRQNFPWKKLKDIINGVASIQELKEELEKDEI